MTDRMPEQFLARLKRIPPQQRWAFAGAWAAGLFAHGYMLANKLPNHDDVFNLWGKGGAVTLGRWLLTPLGRLAGNFSSPWMLGLLALFFVSLAAMLIVRLLRLESPLFCFLAGAVLAAFPTVTSTFAYMFTSDAYMFGFLLAVLCAWLCGKGGWYRLAAAGCLILSLGSYQGFLGWAVALMMYTLLDRCLEKDAEVKPIFREGLWDVGVLAVGLAGYVGITRLLWALTGTGSGGYQNLDNMGRISLAALPGQLWDCYSIFFNIFRDSTKGVCTTPGLRFLLTACQWLAILLIAVRAWRQFAAGKRAEAALAALLGVLMPVGVNIVCLMSAGLIHTIMVYPMCMIPLVFLAGCERLCAAAGPDAKPAQKRMHALGRWVCVLLVALLAGRYAGVANECYLSMQINHSRRVAYWTTVVTQIKSLPGYDQWLPVVLINESGQDRSTPDIWQHPETIWDIEGVRLYTHMYSDEQFLERYIGFVAEFPDPAGYAGLPEVQAMPPYPADGSMRTVQKDDQVVIVVKF